MASISPGRAGCRLWVVVAAMVAVHLAVGAATGSERANSDDALPDGMTLWRRSLEVQRLPDSRFDGLLTNRANDVDTLTLHAHFVAKLEANNVSRMVLVRIASAGPLNGSSFLTYEHLKAPHDLWIYLPAVATPRRLVASNLGDSFLGTELRLGDLVQPDPDDYVVTLQGTDAIDGESYWRIETAPRTQDIERDTGIGKTLLWLRKDSLVEARIEQFDRRGLAFKMEDVKQWTSVVNGTKWFALERYMKNLQSGVSTSAIFSNLEVGVGIPEAIFAPQHLAERGW